MGAPASPPAHPTGGLVRAFRRSKPQGHTCLTANCGCPYPGRRLPEGTTFVLDAGDYLKEKEKRIEKIVDNAARKVKREGGTEKLPQMNAYERRIAHQRASYIEGVSSSSEGEGLKRRVVIGKK